MVNVHPQPGKDFEEDVAVVLILEPDLIKLPHILKAIHSGDPEQELVGCTMARQLLPTGSEEAEVDTIFKSGILPKCIELLTNSSFETQIQITWLLTNLAVGTPNRANHLIELGAVDPLVQLIHSNSAAVAELAVHALANIIGSDPWSRDIVIKAGGVPKLVSLAMSPDTPFSLLSRTTWALFNLCRVNKPPTPMEAVHQMFPALAHLLHLDDLVHHYVVFDAALALSLIIKSHCSQGKQVIDDVLNVDGLASRLVHLLTLPESQITKACLETVGNIIRGNDAQVDRMRTAGPLIQILSRLMQSKEPKTAYLATWITSNIAAGSRDQLNSVITGGLLPILINVLKNGPEFESAKKEAVVGIIHIASVAPDASQQPMCLCQNGVLTIVCSMLKNNDSKDVLSAVKVLDKLFTSTVGEKAREYRKAVEECGGLDSLKHLAAGPPNLQAIVAGNDKTSKIASSIVEKFFQKEDNDDKPKQAEDEDTNAKPAKVQKMDI